MKIRITLDIDSRPVPGWSRPADAEVILDYIRDEWEGADVETSTVSFEVTNLETEVIQP